jgi:hypothetical protein
MKNVWLLSGVPCVIGVRTPEPCVKFRPIALLLASPARLGIAHSVSQIFVLFMAISIWSIIAVLLENMNQSKSDCLTSVQFLPREPT